MSQSRAAQWAALPPRRSLLAFAGGALAAGLAGCSIPTRLAAVPRGRASDATVLGVPNERFFPTEAAGQAELQREFVAAVQRQLASRGLPPDVPVLELDLLGISGGGENGAFGAGLLNGWTERGGRPTFFLVTGISTGALSAPFAFLGSAWDAKLKSVYTDITLADVLVRRGYTAAIWNDGMADNSPLFRTISRFLDEAMLAEIGRAYDGGRLLLIATSDLDAQMPVIWNIGAIARSGHPRALDTVRRMRPGGHPRRAALDLPSRKAPGLRSSKTSSTGCSAPTGRRFPTTAATCSTATGWWTRPSRWSGSAASGVPSPEQVPRRPARGGGAGPGDPPAPGAAGTSVSLFLGARVLATRLMASCPAVGP